MKKHSEITRDLHSRKYHPRIVQSKKIYKRKPKVQEE